MLRLLAAVLAAVLMAAAPALAQSNVRIIQGANLTWSRATLTLNGASQQLLAATAGGSAARGGFILVNPTGNATVFVNLAGTTATSSDIPVAAGTSYSFTGGTGPINAVTIIGTNTQVVTIFTGQ